MCLSRETKETAAYQARNGGDLLGTNMETSSVCIICIKF